MRKKKLVPLKAVMIKDKKVLIWKSKINSVLYSNHQKQLFSCPPADAQTNVRRFVFVL